MTTIAMFFNSPFFLMAKQATDPFYDELWYLEQIDVPEAWDITTGSNRVIVAVLDAGFDLDHPDLESQFWVNEDETPNDQKDNDANGFEDDVQGWDFVDSDPDPSPEITSPINDAVLSHGTVVSGLIGAIANNGEGMTGVNWDVSIMPLRILDERGVGSTALVRQAIEYAVLNGADIINLSLTATFPDDRLDAVIQWAHEQGVVIVAAAGNGNVNVDRSPVYPACSDVRLGKNIVIGVAATDAFDEKASFSNFGSTCVDLAAPGTNIFSTVYEDVIDPFLSTAYSSPWEGSSLSAPLVSAAAALMKARYPFLTPEQIRLALKLSVDPIMESSIEARKNMGAGRLNVSQALMAAEVFAQGAIRTQVRPTINRSHSLIAAQGKGQPPLVRRLNSHGDTLNDFFAYDQAFIGGVRLVMADVTGDGTEEIVTGAGAGGGPQVRIFDVSGKVLGQFFAFAESDRRGIFLAAGDDDGDGIDEIFVTQGEGGTGQVRVFNRHGDLTGAFYPFGRTTAVIRVAVGNVDDDAASEIVTSLGSSSGGRIRVFDDDGSYQQEFVVLSEPITSLSVALGDLDGDGSTEIIAASGVGHEPFVAVYNEGGKELKRFFVFQTTFIGGVELAVGDIDGNGKKELYVSPFTNGGPHIRIFNESFDVIGGFFAFDSLLRDGSFIGIWNP